MEDLRFIFIKYIEYRNVLTKCILEFSLIDSRHRGKEIIISETSTPCLIFVTHPALPLFLPLFFFLPSPFSFALVVLFPPLSFLWLSLPPSFPLSSCPYSPPLNFHFLQCSSGLLFAGQSQVNCVCSFSVCFRVCDRVCALK